MNSSTPTKQTVPGEHLISFSDVASILRLCEENDILKNEGARILEDMIAKEILRKHPYEISFWESDQYWHTYLPDQTKKHKRKSLKRKSKEALERAVVKFYLDKDRSAGGITVQELYLEWLDFKELHTRSTGTMKRLSADWSRFYEGQEISKKKVKDLTELYLDEWIHSTVKKYHLNRKAYYNMSMPLRQMLKYAVKKGYIGENPFEAVQLNTKILEGTVKKDDNTQVFMIEEVPLIREELKRHYSKYPANTAALAVMLAFETGVRVGELVAIKDSDISGNILHIQRQESKTYKKNKDGVYSLNQIMVVEHTKSDAGDRKIPLTKEAQEIIAEIKYRNMINGESCDGYLFVKGGKRIKSRAVVYQVDRCLNALSMEHRSIHKVRKTFVSALIDGGVNINEIRKIVGHADVKTTYDCYCYNRYGEEETRNQIQNALHPQKDNYVQPITEEDTDISTKSEGFKGVQKIISFPGNKKMGNRDKIKASR